ncbi:MAG: ATP-dependent Clp protease proteolytic subunit [Patescibacteria group bacterium]
MPNEKGSFKINPERSLFLNSGFTEKDANLLIKQLYDLNLKEGEIFLQMNGSGGSFAGAKKLFDNVQMSLNPVTGVVTGDAFSAIAVILQACHKRCATKHSRIHIHNVSCPVTLTIGPDDNIIDLNELVLVELNRVKLDNSLLINILSERMEIGKIEVKKILDKDSTLTPKQALELRLIDEIV